MQSELLERLTAIVNQINEEMSSGKTKDLSDVEESRIWDASITITPGYGSVVCSVLFADCVVWDSENDSWYELSDDDDDGEYKGDTDGCHDSIRDHIHWEIIEMVKILTSFEFFLGKLV